MPRAALALLLLTLAASPAAAQSDSPIQFQGGGFGGGGGSGGGHGRGGRHGGDRSPPPAAAEDPLPVPHETWPRLDAGAILCQSQDDLARRAAALSGTPIAGRPPQCHPMLEAAPIAILSRVTPGITQVKLPTGATGWTDAWLPDRPPMH